MSPFQLKLPLSVTCAKTISVKTLVERSLLTLLYGKELKLKDDGNDVTLFFSSTYKVYRTVRRKPTIMHP